MEVRFLASGEILTTLEQDVFDGKTAREVKQTLAAHVRVSRFRQRLFAEDGFREIQDEVFGSAPLQHPVARTPTLLYSNVGVLSTGCCRGRTYDFCMPKNTSQPEWNGLFKVLEIRS